MTKMLSRQHLCGCGATQALLYGEGLSALSHTGHTVSSDSNSQQGAGGPRAASSTPHQSAPLSAPPSPASRAQVGSDVLLWSEGNTPMTLSLSFPDKLTDDCIGNAMQYTKHPAFTFPCAGGTLFIFTCVDDLFFCHEAEFDQQIRESAAAAGHRFVFVFRWLTSVRQFHTDPMHKYGMEVPPQLLAKVKEAKKKKAAAKRKLFGLGCR